MIRHLSTAVLLLIGVSLWSSACAPISPRKGSTRPAIDQEPVKPAPSDDAPDPELAALLAAHNQKRAASGRPPLALNAKLSAAAKVQADDMAGHSKMSHQGSDGSSPFQRIERQGYRFRSAAENVAYGQKDVDSVMTSWMESPLHKINILGDYTEMGAAKILDKDGVPYWCVDFGRPWPTIPAETAASAALKAINEARAAEKLPALILSTELNEAASHRAKFLATKAALEAREEDGKTPLQKLADEDRFLVLAEGDASGVGSAEELIKGWLGDKAQRKNLLGDFNSVGIGQAAAADGSPYWTIIFGKAK